MCKVDGGNYGDKLAMLPADGHLPGKFYYKMPLQHLPSSSKEARITAKACCPITVLFNCLQSMCFKKMLGNESYTAPYCLYALHACCFGYVHLDIKLSPCLKPLQVEGD